MAEHEMQYRALGRCGMKVSVFGLGGWLTFGGQVRDAKIIQNILHAAFDAGINFFDTADVYAKGESELVMGQQLRTGRKKTASRRRTPGTHGCRG